MTDRTLPSLSLLREDELDGLPLDPDAGLGCLSAPGGNLPLTDLDLDVMVTGLTWRAVMRQVYVNPHREPVEATYVFPLPDRGAVTAMHLTVADRILRAELRERGEARAEYDAALAEGRRASIAEEERPDVFTLRVGNLLPGDRVTVELTVVGVLPVADGEATFRFPLVVAPRYVPGVPLPGDAVGSGHQPDTDAVPDASRISPPVLLPGFPDPVRLSAAVTLDPAGLPMGEPRSSLHAVSTAPGRVVLRPGQRADRDIVLRIPLGAADGPSAALTLVPDPVPVPAEDGSDGTFEVVVLPPDLAVAPPPRDVVLLLDRSGSMDGWKMVAARRAAARIVDSLTPHDRFAVLAFDHEVCVPGGRTPALVAATDRARFRAVEFLATLDARGGTELAQPLRVALDLLGATAGAGPARPAPVIVLVTDGQVGNEDQLLGTLAAGLDAVRVHTVGIDRAVNAGFLGRLAAWGRGRCELVESEDRLDAAMARIHERIGSPLVTGLTLEASGLQVLDGTTGTGPLPDVFPGVPWVLRGRYRGSDVPRITVRGTARDGEPWSVTVEGQVRTQPAAAAVWARGQVRDLEDRYVVVAAGGYGADGSPSLASIEQRIVATSLRFGVLCRFTAYVVVDDRVVTDGTAPRPIVQPVERPDGWTVSSRSVAATPVLFAMARRRGTSALPPSMPAPGSPVPPPPVPAWAAPVSAAPFSGAPAPSGAGAPPSPVVGGGGPGDPTWSLLDRELTRLRGLADVPPRERRAALADLGSCLAALPVPGWAPAEHWQRLLAVLADPSLTTRPLDALWQEVITVLAALLEVPPPPARAAVTPTGLRRPAFWRHHPET